MKGLPFSGKTEWATEWADSDPVNRLRLSWTDTLRMMGDRRNRYRRVVAFEGCVHMMADALRNGLSVVIDEENLDSITWSLFVTRAQQLHARVVWHNTRATADECKQRMLQYFDSDSDDARRHVLDIDRKASLFAEWLKQ